MPFDPGLSAVIFSLAAALSWGVGDFSGGLSSRKTSVFAAVIVSQLAGLLLLIGIAAYWHEPYPSMSDLGWGVAAGVSGGIGLAALYRALAMGKMGLAAPFVAVLGGGIPVMVGIVLEGTPGTAQLLGFAVAMLAVWLIARPGGGGDSRAGLGMAILAGTFIGLFLICLDRIQGDGLFWSLAVARLSSMLLMTLIALFSRQRILPDGGALPLILFAGLVDVLGNAFFVLAARTGRLDAASVLASLYPMVTVVLARVVLKERVNAMQALGIVLAMVAIVLIAL